MPTLGTLFDFAKNVPLMKKYLSRISTASKKYILRIITHSGEKTPRTVAVLKSIYLQEVVCQKKYLLSSSSYWEELAAPDN